MKKVDVKSFRYISPEEWGEEFVSKNQDLFFVYKSTPNKEDILVPCEIGSLFGSCFYYSFIFNEQLYTGEVDLTTEIHNESGYFGDLVLAL